VTNRAKNRASRLSDRDQPLTIKSAALSIVGGQRAEDAIRACMFGLPLEDVWAKATAFEDGSALSKKQWQSAITQMGFVAKSLDPSFECRLQRKSTLGTMVDTFTKTISSEFAKRSTSTTQRQSAAFWSKTQLELSDKSLIDLVALDRAARKLHRQDPRTLSLPKSAS